MTLHKGRPVEMLPGYRRRQHMVYADFYPTNNGDFEKLREALETLCAVRFVAVFFDPVTSEALGFGFRCGFLGLLHMEIVQQRLEREHDMDMIQTAPTVTYKVELPDGLEAGDPLPGPASGARTVRAASPSPSRARPCCCRPSTSAR